MNLKIWFYFQRAWNWSGAWKEEADDAGEVVVEEVVVLLLLLLVLLLLLLVRHWEGSQCCKGGNPSLPPSSPNTPYYLLAHFIHALLGRLSSPKWMKFRKISLQIFSANLGGKINEFSEKGGRFTQIWKILLQILVPSEKQRNRVFRNEAGGGGCQRPCGSFPKIHPWGTQASLCSTVQAVF